MNHVMTKLAIDAKKRKKKKVTDDGVHHISEARKELLQDLEKNMVLPSLSSIMKKSGIITGSSGKTCQKSRSILP